jgi:secondary thiamine-phosphate synthase enzyme
MGVFRFERQFSGTSDVDVFDLTPEVESALRASGVRDGLVLLFVPGSTAALTTIEFETGVVEDLKQALERLAPRSIPYRHDEAWGDGNGYSHVRSALVGPSLSLPVEEGRLVLGTWQQVVLLDFDNQPRRRRVLGYVYDFGAGGSANGRSV